MPRRRVRPSCCGCWKKSAQPYDIKLVRLSAGDNLKPDYLAINPMGKVPTLRARRCGRSPKWRRSAHISPTNSPPRKLNVPVGTPRRGEYLKWLFFGPSVIEPAMTDRAFPRKEDPRAAALGWRDFDTVLDIVSKALTKGPHLMGEQFTAADVVIGSGLRLRHDVQNDPRAEGIYRITSHGSRRGLPRNAPRRRTRNWAQAA